jgi:hypothetical protein
MPTISGFSRPIQSACIPGGPVGEFSVPGNLRPGHFLLSVEELTDAATPTRVDRTGEFSITPNKNGRIQNTTTNTTGKFLLVTWCLDA